MTADRAFPEGFLWGAATASYQIEGAFDVDGRSESIWDRFAKTPGRVVGGDTGDIACDHYHRWREDIALMADLGLDAYRFSVSWPRVVPTGRGPVNPAGLDFYDRLVDGLLGAGIEPFLTLYHWDLPQVLEDQGGWPVRATAEAFAEYSAVVAERLGDRVQHWTTLNEPWVSAHLGYGVGEHAPGRTSVADEVAAAHHLLLAHGLATNAIRSIAPSAKVGLVVDLHPAHPVSSHPLDVAAAHLDHILLNRWYLDPVMGRGYPTDGVRSLNWDQNEIKTGDYDIIAAPLDFLGVNYYSVRRVQSPHLREFERYDHTAKRRTAMGWEVYPDGLAEVLEWVWYEYRIPELYITENGAAYTDNAAEPEHDPERVQFLHDHIETTLRAIARGVPVRGYFVWSLLDNFEWALGYQRRFGIIHVDYKTLERIPRDSARYWAAVAASGEIEPVTAYCKPKKKETSSPT